MTKKDLSTILATGCDRILSHGRSHEVLTAMNDEEVLQEMQTSKFDIESFTGNECSSFVYPVGIVDERIKNLCAQAGYQFGYTANNGFVMRGIDKMVIPRINIPPCASVEEFAVRVSGLVVALSMAKSWLKRFVRLDAS